MVCRPMPLVRIPEPFDHPDWVYEPKFDGFRALAYVDGHRCRLMSRRGHEFTKWDVLCTEISHGIRATSAVLDGEIVCLDRDGRSNFNNLLLRRDWPYFYAFDLLMVGGEDLRDRPLIERKRHLKAVMPYARVHSRLLYVDDIGSRGVELFDAACKRDLEGIVAKWRRGTYSPDGISTSWLKIKNPNYTQVDGRRELFERRRDRQYQHRRDYRAPVLELRF
jgi:bifunctional non-homologous end joining protein LigD